MGQEPTPEAQPEPAAPAEPKGGQEPQGFDALPEETKAEIKRLRAEAASHRREAQEARTKVEEYEAANQSELEKLAGKVTKAERERDEAKATLLRYEVAAEKSVPPKLVPLLTASSREELETQAALILENAKPADPDFDGGPREPAPEPKTPEEAHNEVVTALFGGSSSQ